MMGNAGAGMPSALSLPEQERERVRGGGLQVVVPNTLSGSASAPALHKAPSPVPGGGLLRAASVQDVAYVISPGGGRRIVRTHASEVRKRARTLVQEEKLAASIEAWGEAIAEDPKNPHNYIGRGLAHARLNDFQAAMADVTTASAMAPHDVDVLRAKALVLTRARKFHDGAQFALQAMQRDPGDLKSNDDFRFALEKLRRARPHFIPPPKERVIHEGRMRFDTPPRTPTPEEEEELLEPEWEEMLRRLADLIDPTVEPRAQRRKIRETVKVNMSFLVRTFEHYRGLRDDPPAKTTFYSLTQLLRDCKVPCHTISMAAMDRLALTTLREEPNPPQDPHEGANELGLTHWVESLVRIANVARSTNEKLPAERFTAFVASSVVPHAGQSSRDRFQTTFYGAEAQAVVQAERARLRKLFRYFILRNADKSSAVQDRVDVTMNFNQMLRMLLDLSLLDPNLTVKRAKDVWVAVTKDEEVAPQEHASNTATEMTFEEFLEACGRMSRIKFTDQSFADAWESFVKKELITCAGRIMPGRL
eukprot:tig00000317_g24015.t1